MGRTCSTDGEVEKYIFNFSLNGRDHLGRPKSEGQDTIKMDLNI
jgi:hypothetical protein